MNVQRLNELATDYCRYVRNADERALTPLKEYYVLGKDSPSTARIIISEAARKSQEYLKEQLQKDILEINMQEAIENYTKGMANMALFGKMLDNHEEIAPLLNEYANKFRELYPLTGAIRMKLIDKARITMDNITPKMNFIEKFKNWRGSVPKEFSKMLKKI